VISDSANPAAEGNVYLYTYGKKIFDKVMDVMQPQFADESPVNPYDFWEGADFKIKIRKVDGWVNYDKSEFASSSSLLDGDEERLEELYNKLYTLSEFTDPKNYKSYDELKAKLNRILGIDAGPTAPAPEFDSAPGVTMNTVTEEESDSDDTLSYFAKLAKEA
jgi:hypothetical protein